MNWYFICELPISFISSMLSFCRISAAKLGARAVSLSDPSFQVEHLEQKPFTLTCDFGSADITFIYSTNHRWNLMDPRVWWKNCQVRVRCLLGIKTNSLSYCPSPCLLWIKPGLVRIYKFYYIFFCIIFAILLISVLKSLQSILIFW